MLSTELHTIKIIKEKISSNADDIIIKGLLLQLFELLSFQEHKLILVFKQTAITDKSQRSRIDNITKSVLLQEELKKEVFSAEERFVQKMKKRMM